MYFYELDCYERATREPTQQHDVTTINCYVHLCLNLAKQSQTTKQADGIYLRMVKNFEEIICDDLLSKDWRLKSYRIFKQVKPILYEVMPKRHYQQLSDRFERLAFYFLNQQCRQVNQKHN
jgi:hypothetical protein